MTDAMRSIACVKIDCILLRAFSGLRHGLPYITCACEEFGDAVLMEDAAARRTKSPCAGEGARGSCRAACAPSVRRAGVGVGVLRKQINNE